jgi:hypothetical protein
MNLNLPWAWRRVVPKRFEKYRHTMTAQSATVAAVFERRLAWRASAAAFTGDPA